MPEYTRVTAGISGSSKRSSITGDAREVWRGATRQPGVSRERQLDTENGMESRISDSVEVASKLPVDRNECQSSGYRENWWTRNEGNGPKKGVARKDSVRAIICSSGALCSLATYPRWGTLFTGRGGCGGSRVRGIYLAVCTQAEAVREESDERAVHPFHTSAEGRRKRWNSHGVIHERQLCYPGLSDAAHLPEDGQRSVSVEARKGVGVLHVLSSEANSVRVYRVLVERWEQDTSDLRGGMPAKGSTGRGMEKFDARCRNASAGGCRERNAWDRQAQGHGESMVEKGEREESTVMRGMRNSARARRWRALAGTSRRDHAKCRDRAEAPPMRACMEELKSKDNVVAGRRQRLRVLKCGDKRRVFTQPVLPCCTPVVPHLPAARSDRRYDKTDKPNVERDLMSVAL
ncbi:hypothetical protein B0H11DRAFT_1899439 [Mycena galericulata]|nr:hypothetical protein B0H11DRAFT_1899439 [Mycena galericulata]